MKYILMILVICLEAISSSGTGIKQHKNYPLLEDVSCGSTPAMNVKPYIMDGKYVFFGEFPWFARISISRIFHNGTVVDWFCGGAIINIKYILTAAQCIELLGKPVGILKITVTLGDLNSTTDPDCEGERCAPPAQRIPVEKFINHKDYKWGKPDNPDISLLRLKRLITYTDFVRPVCLPFNFVDGSGEKLDEVIMNDRWRCCKFPGWGAFSKRGKELLGDSPTRLKSASISVIECNRENRKKYFVCGSGMTGNPCYGDAGGPLSLRTPRGDGYLTHTIVGVLSFLTGRCDRHRTVNYFTNITNYLDWILDNIEP